MCFQLKCVEVAMKQSIHFALVQQLFLQPRIFAPAVPGPPSSQATAEQQRQQQPQPRPRSRARTRAKYCHLLPTQIVSLLARCLGRCLAPQEVPAALAGLPGPARRPSAG